MFLVLVKRFFGPGGGNDTPRKEIVFKNAIACFMSGVPTNRGNLVKVLESSA